MRKSVYQRATNIPAETGRYERATYGLLFRSMRITRNRDTGSYDCEGRVDPGSGIKANGGQFWPKYGHSVERGSGACVILGILGFKGGVGKTTAAIHLAGRPEPNRPGLCD
jgi:hypothetical protein